MSRLADPVVPVPAALSWMFARRSTAALAEPGPDARQLDLILRAATTVPDHGSLHPYRFIVISGKDRAVFAEALARSAADDRPDLPDEAFDKVRKKAFVAPTQILIIASPRPDAKVAEWEQVAAAACTGYAITLAAHGLGLGAVWKSVPFTRGSGLIDVFSLGDHEQMLGWVNLGTTAVTSTERDTVDPARFTTVLSSDGAVAYGSPDRPAPDPSIALQ